MLNQNWFAAKNFVMFCDYVEYQLFYDTETKNIYEVSENIMDVANTTIKEYTPENSNYRRLYAAYESYADAISAVKEENPTSLYFATFAAQVKVHIEAASTEEAKEKVKKMYGEYDKDAGFQYTYLSDIILVTDKDGNEVEK